MTSKKKGDVRGARGWFVEQRSDTKQWVVRFRLADGSWKGKHGIPRDAGVKTPLQAERYAADNITAIREGRVTPPKVVALVTASKGTPIKDLVSRWKRLLKERIDNGKMKRSTVRGHEGNLEAVLAMLGEQHVETFSIPKART